MRVTLYAKVTPAAFNVRGKDAFKSLGNIRNFVT
jgi:hypothetical protein